MALRVHGPWPTYSTVTKSFRYVDVTSLETHLLFFTVLMDRRLYRK